MAWELTEDVETYADHAWSMLAAHPDRNTIALTVIEYVRTGAQNGPPTTFGWWAVGGAVTGAVSLTPPYELLLAVVPDDAVEPLVTAFRALSEHVHGVNGENGKADRFADAWTRGTQLSATTVMRTRLYGLDRLHPPADPPPGHARLATSADVDLATRWYDAFQVEAHIPALDNSAIVDHRVRSGLLWLWEAPGGQVVSLAGRNLSAAGVARVGPVYTPREHRRRGYGAAVTAACTQEALKADARQTVLFTDLANPTSNAIYQRLGYRPIADRRVIRFSSHADVCSTSMPQPV